MLATKYFIDRTGLEPQVPFYRQAQRAARARNFAQQRISPLLFESDHQSEEKLIAVFLFGSLGNEPGE